jgi:hypothetical protein
MHPMKDGVRAGVQVARPLNEPSEKVERALPTLAHRELAMGAVAVVEEALEENGELPVKEEKREDDHDSYLEGGELLRSHVSVIARADYHDSVSKALLGRVIRRRGRRP